MDGTFSGDLTAGTISGNSAAGGAVVGYLKGHWTPVSETGTATPNAAGCWWTRIGDTVTINGDVTAFSDTTSEETVRLLGAPWDYDVNSNVPIGSGRFHLISYDSGAATHSLIGSSGVYFTTQQAGLNAQLLKHSELNNSSSRIIFQFTYVVDDTTWIPQNGATVS